MAKKEKYYLTGSSGQTIITTPQKHPSLWDFISKNWQKISDEYEEVKKAKGILGFVYSSSLPKMMFDQDNWKHIVQETKLKGETIRLSYNSPNAGVVIFKKSLPTFSK